MANDGSIMGWKHHPHTEVMYSFALRYGGNSERTRLAFYDLCDKYQKRFGSSPPEDLWLILWKQSEAEEL